MKNIKRKVAEYLQSDLIDEECEIKDDTSLFQEGLCDSLNLITLVNFLEKEFEVKIGPLDINIESLDTLNAIEAFINKKLAQ